MVLTGTVGMEPSVFRDMTEEEEKNYGPIAKWIDLGLVMLGVSAGYRLYTSVKKFLERNF